MKNTKKKMGSFTSVKLQANNRRLLAIIAIVAVIGLLVSCGGGLNGSYSLQGGGDLTYNFMSGGKITIESDGKVLGEGTFKTSGGKLTITGSEGEQTIDYKLEGKNLIFSMGDQSMTFAKK